MNTTEPIERFYFHGIHPKLLVGSASDRYDGWIGQIYKEDRYKEKITSRSKKVGHTLFKEKVLPVFSVEEYFEHFSFLEIDFTFYSLLLNRELKPTSNFHVLRNYKKHLRTGNQLILKVPQSITAKKLWRNGKYTDNPDFLNPEIFTHRFYRPANEQLGSHLKGFIFEQEYHTKNNRIDPEKNVKILDQFFSKLPKDHRYHFEIRTAAYHTKDYFKLLENHGVGQVLSHWTWLPSLMKQFESSNRNFFNASGQSIIRLITPLRMKYDESYKMAFPFNRLVNGMLNHQMIADTIEIINEAIGKNVSMFLSINNRAGGNAPLIAQRVCQALNFSNGK